MDHVVAVSKNVLKYFCAGLYIERPQIEIADKEAHANIFILEL